MYSLEYFTSLDPLNFQYDDGSNAAVSVGYPSPSSDTSSLSGFRSSRLPPHMYVSLATSHTYTATIKVKDKIRNIPMLARVSIVDYRGRVILDTYVRPTHNVEDYRTAETGLTADVLESAPFFHQVQQLVSSIIHDKVIVGHCLWNALSILGISHPTINTRDMGLYRPLRRKLRSRSTISLSSLIQFYMGRRIGLDRENSVESARACIDLFRSCEDGFETVIAAGSWPCDLPPPSFSQYFS